MRDTEVAVKLSDISIATELADDVVWKVVLEASSLGMRSQSVTIDRLGFYLNDQGD